MENTYIIEIREELSRRIAVTANSEINAMAMVEDMYNREEIVLDSADFVDVECTCVGKEDESGRKEKDLADFLLHETNAGDFVYITECGWYKGCTIIDHEDLFLHSLSPKLLQKKVTKSEYAKTPWSSQKTLVVEIY